MRLFLIAILLMLNIQAFAFASLKPIDETEASLTTKKSKESPSLLECKTEYTSLGATLLIPHKRGSLKLEISFDDLINRELACNFLIPFMSQIVVNESKTQIYNIMELENLKYRLKSRLIEKYENFSKKQIERESSIQIIRNNSGKIKKPSPRDESLDLLKATLLINSHYLKMIDRKQFERFLQALDTICFVG